MGETYLPTSPLPDIRPFVRRTIVGVTQLGDPEVRLVNGFDLDLIAFRAAYPDRRFPTMAEIEAAGIDAGGLGQPPPATG